MIPEDEDCLNLKMNPPPRNLPRQPIGGPCHGSPEGGGGLEKEPIPPNPLWAAHTASVVENWTEPPPPPIGSL